MGLQACATLAFYTSLSTSKFAIVLRGTLSQDDIVDAEGLPGQVRDLELLNLEDLGIRSFNEACYISLGTDSRLRHASAAGELWAVSLITPSQDM